jgi:hypothetical protein
MIDPAKPSQNGLATLTRYRLALCYHGYDLETRQSHKSIGLVAPHARLYFPNLLEACVYLLV